ncbi:MmcQ/YjbR family DNA-binding protein [Geodermatophilus sp. DF01-2]|uniref:MmcQ/YjbR family DNA-binding protein n=1 Tax=Geodermatophilus sp. DF01-2 TaxID=2559610 RepID=UPI001074942D|nr:MmcQ/YjbR family DNA-binding protein [Geodermatophilus sp. DF01_2]TFV57754.1 MmcQ/YjbR family DNA-binding protein [Geodermatophilus sp. DF01_2]
MPATPDDVRAAALALPETTERPAWDMACLRVRDRIFASMPPDETWVAIRLGEGENRALAAERPGVFSVPHHYRNSTMVVVRLAAVDPAELAELLTEAWRLRAPARLRAAIDGAGGPVPDTGTADGTRGASHGP